MTQADECQLFVQRLFLDWEMSEDDTGSEVFVWSCEGVYVWIPHSEGNTGQFKTLSVCVCV